MSYKYRHREVYRNVRIDVKAHTSKELLAKVQKKKDEIDRGIIDDRIKLQDFGEKYLEAHKLHTVSAAWYKSLHYTLNSIVHGIGNVPIANIRPLDLQNYINSLSGSASHIKKHYDLICQIFRNAYRNGLTPTDYSIGLTHPSGNPVTSGRSITDHERDTLLKVLRGHRGELFCKLMLFCGLRPSEAQALIWKDIDLKKKTVTVNKSMKENGTVGPPKTSAACRTVPIPDHMIPIIHKGKPFDNVFSHNLTWRRRMWDNVKREMNLAMGCRTYRNKLVPPYPLADDFILYNLRHTYCTDLERAGVPINIASRLMGHSDISVTSKIYTHASTEAMEMARDLINTWETEWETSATNG